MAVWPLFVVIVLVLLNGVFAMSELAVVSARRVRLQKKAEGGDKGAATALELAAEPGRLLSTVQVGITLIGVLLGAYGEATLAAELGAWLDRWEWIAPNGDDAATAIVVVGIVYLSLIFGELVPKRLALLHAERIASAVSRVMSFLSRAAAPFVWLLAKSTELVLALLRVREQAPDAVTEEEIRSMIAEGTQTGVFVEAERDMIEGVLRLADRAVRAIMTPRPDVVWLDVQDPPASIQDEILASGYSRFPVCRGDLDEVLGLVQAKDLLERALKGAAFELHPCLKPPLVVHDAVSSLRVLELFKQSGAQMALVVDEYGSVEGIVTMTDILQSIAGELPEAGDANELRAQRREDGSWLIDAGLTIEETEDMLGVDGMGEDGDFHTLAGFVLQHLGHVPSEGEIFEWRGFRFEVIDMDGRRVDKVLVTPNAA